MLPFSLHGYRTSARTSTGASPFSLVYGMEVFLPIEIQIPSLRIMKDAGLNKDGLFLFQDEGFQILLRFFQTYEHLLELGVLCLKVLDDLFGRHFC